MSENEQTTGLMDGNAAENAADGNDNADIVNTDNEGSGIENNTNSQEDGQQQLKQDTSNNEFYGAPEAYDFKDVQLPEGFKIDEALAAKFAPLGKELNLSQQGANKLANLLVEFQQSQLANADERMAEFKKQERAATKLSYEKLLNTDKEIGGGDTAKMNAYIDIADVGYNSFASDELKGLLHDLQLDFHPAVIKHFHRLGKLCGNDKVTKTNSPVAPALTPAQILYGNNDNQSE